MCIQTQSTKSQWTNGEFGPAGNAINHNHQVYITILRMQVIPFIREKYGNCRYYFWPDLASAHYANATQQFLKDEGIRYIPKNDNPPAVAFFRPIEDLWVALKKEKYGSRWEAEDLAQLKGRILAKASQILLDVTLNLFRTVRNQTQKCMEKGYLAVHRWALFKKSGL